MAYEIKIALPQNTVVKALLADGWRWTDNGPGTWISYQFVGDAWRDIDKAAYQYALAQLSAAADVDFYASNKANFRESIGSLHEVRSGFLGIVWPAWMGGHPDAWAWHQLPSSAGAGNWVKGMFSGQSPYDIQDAFTAAELAPGSLYARTYVHELMHGLGLKHPFEASSEAPKIAAGLDHALFTTMAYNRAYSFNGSGTIRFDGKGIGGPTTEYGHADGPMALDIAALHHLYGSRPQATGANVYALTGVNGPGATWHCIWDTGGTDEIQYAGTGDAILNLKAATLKNEVGGGGFLNYVRFAAGGFTIANGVTIENASTGSGNDSIIGNAFRNEIKSGQGADTIYGDDGNDIIWLDAGADYQDGGEGTDILSFTNATWMDFEHGEFAGDATGDAGWDNFEIIRGSAGNDRIISRIQGAATARYIGGAGDDTLSGGAARDDLRGGTQNDTISGYGGWDDLYGDAGDDTLSGGTGNDWIEGGLGRDTLSCIDHRGFDRLLPKDSTTGWSIDMSKGMATTISRSALGATTIESDRFTSIENALGSIGNDTFYASGNSAELNGVTGVDTLWLAEKVSDAFTVGGKKDADDLVVVDNSTSVRTATANVKGTLVSYRQTTTFYDIEVLHANTGNDTVRGSFTDETLYGDAGKDRIFGGAGADTIVGGTGQDVMGGAADPLVSDFVSDHSRDIFVFGSQNDTGKSVTSCDTIDFFDNAYYAGSDRVDLRGIDAKTTVAGNDAFTWKGLVSRHDAFAGKAGELHYFTSGQITYVEGDLDGDKHADFMIGFGGSLSLASRDFLL